MSSADVAVFLGLRALRAGRRTDAAAAFARAQKMVGGKGWPYPVLDRLLTP